jgi:RNA polymerase sigma-70 factor (ECF subfamily)
MSMEVPAEDLLVRIARQDVDALSELYDRYAPRIYGLMLHILSSREAAELVLRDVFARVWSESARLSQEGGSVVAWLVVTARNRAVEQLRTQRTKSPAAELAKSDGDNTRGAGAATRKSKGSAVPSADKAIAGKPGAPNPSTAKAGRSLPMDQLPAAWLPQPKAISFLDERLALLHKVIAQLPSSQREALELAVFGGLSELEIAAETGEPLGKVQRSLRAAITFVKHRRRAVCGTWAANI